MHRFGEIPDAARSTSIRIRFSLGQSCRQIRHALSVRGFPSHILCALETVDWLLHSAGFSCFVCRFGAIATGNPIEPRKSTCVCSSCTSRSPRNKSNSGLCFCVPVPRRYPEQATHVQTKTAEDVSTLGYYWYTVGIVFRVAHRSRRASRSSTKSTRCWNGPRRARFCP